MKVCATKHCPVLTARSYCDEHQAERDRARGTTKQRGYSGRHQSTRAEIVAAMEQGTVIRCVTCTSILTPDTFDLGHTDDRTGYVGPQCANKCNRRDAGRRSHLYR